MADLGTLIGLTITMIKHPTSFKGWRRRQYANLNDDQIFAVRGALVDLCARALKENVPVVLYEGATTTTKSER